MKTIIKKLFQIINICILCVILLAAFTWIFVYRVKQRSFIQSEKAYVKHINIPVGSQGYGTISSVNVRIGDKVNNGDTLFTYVKSDLDEKSAKSLASYSTSTLSVEERGGQAIISVKSPASGIIQSLGAFTGGYVTRDDKVVEIQSNSAIAKTEFRIDKDKIRFITSGTKTTIIVPGGKTYVGEVVAIYPDYDHNKSILTLDTSLGTSPDLLDGTPVTVRIDTEDELYKRVDAVIDVIPFSFVRNFLR